MKLKYGNEELAGQPPKVKGIDWLLDGAEKTVQTTSHKVILGMSKSMQHNTKWKKNTANRFAGFSKIIERTLENRLREEDSSYNSYQYPSLRQTESILNPRKGGSGKDIKDGKENRLNGTYHAQRSSIDQTIFGLRKEEKSF